MKPLVCFYQNDQSILSENYELVSCSEKQSVFDFLNAIQKDYSSQMKVLQINFEAFQVEKFKHLPLLHKIPKASVFLLKNYDLISKNDFSKEKVALPLFRPLMSRSDFMDKVRKLKHEISNGRFYQVNLTSGFKAESVLGLQNSYLLFQHLSHLYPGRYSAFLPSNDFEILCYSPELFLQKSKDVLKTQPIKGTMKPSENFFEHLLKNPKEAAELSMIVDLLRNDLNSVATTPAVVTRHRQQMNLEYTTHTYSEISVNTKQTLPVILQNTMPGGSISGCPKLESLKAIAEHETHQRQFYTGCIGWWLQDDFTLNIAIRSFLKTQNEMFYFAGCGIVYDSNAEKEWDEFLTKAGKLPIHYE